MKIVEFGEIAQLARATGSYPVGREFKSHSRYHLRPVGQEVKTTPFHGVIMGSIPVRVTRIFAHKWLVYVICEFCFMVCSLFCPLSVLHFAFLSFAVTYAPCFFFEEKSSTEAIASPAFACAS